MRVIYNDVDMMALETHDYSWESVYDDSMSDYLFTRVFLSITALVNGQVGTVDGNGPFMSYAKDGPGGTITAGVPRTASQSNKAVVSDDPGHGTMPPGAGLVIGGDNRRPVGLKFTAARPFKTQEAVRHRLDTHRGQLFVFCDSDGLEAGAPPDPANANLISPSIAPLPAGLAGAAIGVVTNVRRPCDCKNGPFAKAFNVSQVMANDNTWVVDWACETFVNEAAENGVSPSGGLLSNRFSQSHSVSDDGFTTVTTEGLAVFRTDYVYATGTNPDSQRAVLFMPIPQGFTREILYVEGRPDVTGIAYGYRDTQVAVNFVAGPYAKAAKIVAVHRQAVTSNADILSGALSVYDRVQGTLLNGKWLRQGEAEKPEAPGKPKGNKARALPPRPTYPGPS